MEENYAPAFPSPQLRVQALPAGFPTSVFDTSSSHAAHDLTDINSAALPVHLQSYCIFLLHLLLHPGLTPAIELLSIQGRLPQGLQFVEIIFIELPHIGLTTNPIVLKEIGRVK